MPNSKPIRDQHASSDTDLPNRRLIGYAWSSMAVLDGFAISHVGLRSVMSVSDQSWLQKGEDAWEKGEETIRKEKKVKEEKKIIKKEERTVEKRDEKRRKEKNEENSEERTGEGASTPHLEYQLLRI